MHNVQEQENPEPPPFFFFFFLGDSFLVRCSFSDSVIGFNLKHVTLKGGAANLNSLRSINDREFEFYVTVDDPMSVTRVKVALHYH